MPFTSTWPTPGGLRPVFGRDRLIDDCRAALAEARLVTLVGDVGMGRTTVARHVLAARVDTGGSLGDVAIVGRPNDVVSHGAPTVEDLLASCGIPTATRVLAISRAPLGIPGERIVRVRRLDDEAAAELFAHAVRELGRGAVLEAAAVADVEQLCGLLEGWPLAIELAARRTTVQSVPEVLAALRAGSLVHNLDAHAMPVEGSAHPTSPDGSRARTPTIRAAVLSGLGRLPPDERSLAMAIGAFVDWSALPEIVAATRGSSATLPQLEALVHNHLVDVDDTGAETLFRLRRPYREALLAESTDEPTDARSARLAALGAQARQVVDGLIAWSSVEESAATWYAVVRRRERDFRAAARELLAEEGRERVLSGADLVLALSMYAAECSDLQTDDGLLDRAVSAVDGLDAPWTALMLEAYRLRRRFESVDPTVDTDRLAADLAAAVSAAEALGDERVIIECLGQSIGSARTIGHLDQARRHAEHGVALATSSDRQAALAHFEMLSAMVAHAQGRFTDAAGMALRAHSRGRRLGMQLMVGQSALMFHQLPPETPGLPRLRPSVQDIALLLEGLPAERTTIGFANGLAAECLAVGDLSTAARATATGLRTAAAMTLPAAAGIGIILSAVLASAAGHAATAARLHGAIDDHLAVVRHGMSPGHQAVYEGAVDAVRQALGSEVFDLECGQGATWTWSHTVDVALRLVESIAVPDPSAADPGAHLVDAAGEGAKLTPRQLEVLALLAAGLSNKEISELLCVAPKTTMHHTSNIYRRLGVRGRGQAAAWARQYGIS